MRDIVYPRRKATRDRVGKVVKKRGNYFRVRVYDTDMIDMNHDGFIYVWELIK